MASEPWGEQPRAPCELCVVDPRVRQQQVELAQRHEVGPPAAAAVSVALEERAQCGQLLDVDPLRVLRVQRAHIYIYF